VRKVCQANVIGARRVLSARAHLRLEPTERFFVDIEAAPQYDGGSNLVLIRLRERLFIRRPPLSLASSCRRFFNKKKHLTAPLRRASIVRD
jgi:hypothetical protein